MKEQSKDALREQYISWAIEQLDDWSWTFVDVPPSSNEDEDYNESEAYDYIQSLIKRLKENSCDKECYENILFHLWQKNAFD